MANQADKGTYEEKNCENAVILLIKRLGYTYYYGPGNHEVIP